MDDERSIRDKVCVAGIGQTEFTKYGVITRPEFQLAIEAILATTGDSPDLIPDFSDSVAG